MNVATTPVLPDMAPEAGTGADRGGPGLEGLLDHTRLVPRTLVHKTSSAEVLLTDAVRLDDDRFAVGARWPADHRLYRRSPDGESDPFFLIETVRQALIYVSHRFYDVPMDHPFVLRDLCVEPSFAGLPDTGSDALPVTLDVSFLRAPGHARRFGVELEAVLYAGGRVHGRARLSWEVLAPRSYQVLRRRNCPAPGDPSVPSDGLVPLPPMAVGHAHDRDVLLASDPDGQPGRWWLRMDRSHPVLFDHEGDHIPGVVLLESFRQAARVVAAQTAGHDPAPRLWRLASIAASYEAFGEYDRPVTVTARPWGGAGAGRLAVHTSAVQGGQTLVSGVLRAVAVRPLRGAAC
nr:ScbA/BarX family gamma-butyrolactone biosynthesis protein [Streptomyces sp. Xyl84]